jgi:hypothetical protein
VVKEIDFAVMLIWSPSVALGVQLDLFQKQLTIASV